jgi:hypothetical protein
MDLKETWKKLELEKLQKPVTGAVEVRKTSRHPVQKLIIGFQVALGFVICFGGIFLYLMIVMPQPIVKFFMMLMIIAYIFYFIVNYRVLKKIRNSNRMDLSLLSTLKQVHDNVQSSLAFQRKSSLLIYPFAAAAGFILGLSTHDEALVLLQKKEILISLLVAVIILTPLSYYLAVWMERLSYGKYLKQLHELIVQFEQEEN